MGVGGNLGINRKRVRICISQTSRQGEGREVGQSHTTTPQRRPRFPPASQPARTEGGRGNRLGCEFAATSALLLAASPTGHRARICFRKEGGGEEGALCETSPRGWGFEVPRPDTHPPSPSQKQQAARPGTGVWGATSWSWPGAAGRGHRRCRQRTPGSAGRAPTHPSRCCTPARCLSRC